MGSILVCIGCYCCLFTIKPLYIEWMAFIANLIEIGFLIWGIVDIPFGDLNTGGKVCFYITCGLILLTFILLIILIVLRCGKKINTTRNSTAQCLCISILIFDVLAFIMVIISEIVILHKMWDLDEDNYYWSRRERRYYGNGYFSDTEWAAAIISTSAAELGILAHFYCISFDMKLIHFKTDLSYNEYMDVNNNNSVGIISNSDINREQGTTINVYNTPPPNQNNLNFLGYDKNGYPIYAGTNQFRMVNTPIVVQPNVNQNNNVNNNINNNINNKNIKDNNNDNSDNNIK